MAAAKLNRNTPPPVKSVKKDTNTKQKRAKIRTTAYKNRFNSVSYNLAQIGQIFGNEIHSYLY